MSLPWVWVLESVVVSLHEAQLVEHGGAAGMRDAALLSSAIARPRNLHAYRQDPGAAELAAAYAFGIVQNHPFVDGNKRAAFVTMELFLNLNGYSLVADDASSISQMEGLAGGGLSESEFCAWIAAFLVPIQLQ